MPTHVALTPPPRPLQVGWSPDGRYVVSGDAEGRAFFWEWQHPHKVVRSMKAHDQVCVGVAWNPLETSKVATCSWDGLIKYWD
jgi:pre-mRNA-processing factor 17